MAQVLKRMQHPESPKILSPNRLSPEQMQCESDYWRATDILQKMLSKGLITDAEFHKIDKLNRQSFSPQLASIMP
jgi:hypothetical protein